MCKSTQQALFVSSLERRSFLALEDPTLCTEMMLSWEVGASFIPQWAVCSAQHSVQGGGRPHPVGSSLSRAQKEQGVSRLGPGVGISMRYHVSPRERHRHTTTLGNATEECSK